MTTADWRRSWDLQQNAHEPGREESFSLMLDWVELLAGPPERVLDLACATGSIGERALARFPGARVTAVDYDPVTLALAREAFAGDARVEVVERDLRDPAWSDGLPAPFDAVLTATALHWLYEDELTALYGRLAGLLRPGGVFANRDHVPLEDETLARAAWTAVERHVEVAAAAGADRWDEWWERLEREPGFAPLLAERARRFAGPTGELMEPVAWHRERLLAAGFAGVDAVWRWGNDALLVAQTSRSRPDSTS